MIPSNDGVQLSLVLGLLKKLTETIILFSNYEDRNADKQSARKQQAANTFSFRFL
jgi:hypothetical protein